MRARSLKLPTIFAATALLLAACAAAVEAPIAGRSKSLADASPEPSALRVLPSAADKSPLALIGGLYGWWPDNGGEGRQTVSIEIGKNNNGSFEATIITTGLLDDSVAEMKDILTLDNDLNGNWFITKKQSWHKCWRSGIFRWTTKPCP